MNLEEESLKQIMYDLDILKEKNNDKFRCYEC